MRKNIGTFLFLSLLITLKLIAQTGFKPDQPSMINTFAHERDTVFIPVPVDTVRFAVIAHEYSPERNFWQRNEGTILGSSFAGIVAVISIIATNYFNRKREDKRAQSEKLKEENLYSAVLASIFSVLLSHDERTKRLKEELLAIRDKSIPKKHLIVEKAQVSLSLDLLNQFLIKLLNYEKFNQLLLDATIAYIHRATNLNETLDFSLVIKIKQEFHSDTDYTEAVQEFFKSINRNVETLDGHREKIKEMIVNEVKKFPQIKIISAEKETP